MISSEEKQLFSIKLKNTALSLEKNCFEAVILESGGDAIQYLKKIIHKDSSIGFGGSMTLKEIGFFEEFNKGSYPNLLDRNDPSLSQAEKTDILKKSLTADFFISSANAVSQTGEFVLIDKYGNRNAGITFGPSKRIIIAGRNKIEPDVNSALSRAQNKAAVLNNIRFDTKNPCTESGECMDCSSKDRLCNITTIIHYCQPAKSTLVMLINEDLGF